ncbi:hypothetical protein PHISCL_04214 [Aspergillus sclerotialis]|uniref:Uncharacterized protein n=1 Tax=Aspergillus sclerotialis TaxID=2070753 RepID=A0A3A2ZK78_9EURO|nr:hypothetical protein PHISCL_04214 [Aspergillus sclerotialis]
MSCPKGKLWYVCSKRNFRGCCSADPCGDGICPDGDDTTTSDPSPTTTDSHTTTIDSKPTTTTTTSATSVSSETYLTTKSQSVVTVTATYLSAATTTAASSANDSKSSNKGSIIGGVVGGIIGLLAILALLLFFCRRRRKQGKRFTLVPSSVQDRHNPKGEAKASPQDELPRFSKDRGMLSNDNTLSDTTYNSPGMTLSSIQSSPNSGTHLLADSTKHTRSPCSALPPIPPAVELLASLPSSPDSNPELSDTGFIRPPAELPTSSQRELINVPIEQRLNAPFNVPVSVGGSSISPASDHRRTTSTTSITVPGNEVSLLVDRNDEDSGPAVPRGDGGASSEERRHVMSFMQYDPSLDTEADASLRGSFGKEEDLGVGLGLKGMG